MSLKFEILCFDVMERLAEGATYSFDHTSIKTGAEPPAVDS